MVSGAPASAPARGFQGGPSRVGWFGGRAGRGEGGQILVSLFSMLLQLEAENESVCDFWPLFLFQFQKLICGSSSQNPLSLQKRPRKQRIVHRETANTRKDEVYLETCFSKNHN